MTAEPDITPAPKGLRDLWYSAGGTKFRIIIGRILYRIFRLGGELTAIVLGLGIVIAFALASALDRQSTDVSFLRLNLQIWFAEAFNGKEAEFGRLDIAWLPARESFVLTAEDILIRDEAGELLERFELLRATMRSDAQALYRPNLVNAEVRGGVVSYVEDEEGDITVGLGPPESVGRIGPVYRNRSQTAFGRKMEIGGLETVVLADATLHYRNDVSGMDLVARLDRLATTLSSEGAIVYTAAGVFEQDEGPATFSIGGLTDIELSEIRTKFELRDARPDQIAPSKGRFRELQGIAAPLNLSGEIDFSREDNLRSAALELTVGEGEFRVLRGESPPVIGLDDFIFRASLEPGNDRMTIEQLDLSSDRFSFDATGFFTQLGNLNDGDANSSPEFDLSLRNVEYEATPSWPKNIDIRALDLKGEADFDARTIDIRDGRLAFFDSVFDFGAYARVSESNNPLEVKLDAEMSGFLVTDQVLSAWPDELVGGARRWVERSIIGGELRDVTLGVDLDEDFFAEPELTSDRFQMTYRLQDGDVQYMETMPPARGVQVSGVIDGNSLSAEMVGGTVETVQLDSGRVEIPRLIPKGGNIIISGTGQGEAPDMLAVLDNEPFRFATRYGIDPADIAGTGRVEALVRRPLLEFFPREQINYEMTGGFTGVKAPFSFGRFDIRNGDIEIDVNPERMILTGPIDVGPWRPEMRWQETFGDNPPPTQYSVSGPVTADVLDGLGIASRGWFAGQADVRVDATGRGMNVAEARLTADLTNAALSVERIWMKPEGEAAELKGVLLRDAETGYDVRNAKMSGEGVSLSGDISLEPDYRLKSLDLDSIMIEDLIVGRLAATRRNDRLALDLSGTFLDVSPWMDDAFQTRESGFDIPMELSAKFDRLVLDPTYVVENSDFAFVHTGEVIETARLSGIREAGDLLLELATLENRNRQAVINVPDASDALSAFLGLSNTKGGRLNLEAELPPAGEEGAYIGEADMRDFRLIEAPALAQLLSLASLTGLADTLSGGSMQFNRFTVPFTLQGDQISVRDARLYGPALGMTGDGDIDLDLRVLDFDGTIVPSYTANSILGDIPVLGDLFVQEKDGGLFALTYTVSGPFERTQIAVNPLSALTPGFLRRIFKPERDAVPDDVRAKIEDVAPEVMEGE